MLRSTVQCLGRWPATPATPTSAIWRKPRRLGVTDVMFHRKKGLQPADMTSTPGIYEQLRRFRAGIEAGISYLKRCFGLRRVRLAGPRSLPSLRLVGDRRPQPRGAGPQRAETQADVRLYRDRGGSLKTGSGEPGAPQPPTGPPSPSGITLNRRAPLRQPEKPVISWLTPARTCGYAEKTDEI